MENMFLAFPKFGISWKSAGRSVGNVVLLPGGDRGLCVCFGGRGDFTFGMILPLIQSDNEIARKSNHFLVYVL